MHIRRLTTGTLVADPDRCHGFQETYENSPHKFNIINFVLGINNKQGHDMFFSHLGDNFVQIHVNSCEKQAVLRTAAGATGYLPIEIN